VAPSKKRLRWSLRQVVPGAAALIFAAFSQHDPGRLILTTLICTRHNLRIMKEK
jgi:hypothetical protein